MNVHNPRTGVTNPPTRHSTVLDRTQTGAGVWLDKTQGARQASFRLLDEATVETSEDA
jgi:hypothetical protein